MPEGVEVTLFARSLNEFLKNKKITNVKNLGGRYLKANESWHQLRDLRINQVLNKGKFIYWTFHDSDVVLFNTLGMTGGWTCRTTKHSKVEFELDEKEILFFTDVRNFGTLQIKNKKDLNKKINELGFDVVNNNLLDTDLVNITRSLKNINVCEFLMRQDVLSGIGNYIKAEALWFANINPLANIHDLSESELHLLNEGIKDVINKSMSSGGASIKNYFNFDNQKGEATDFFNVYGKKNDTLGNQVERIETPDKRTTHYAPTKQIIGI